MPKTEVMARLKSETADLHDSAERQEFQRRMVRGQLSREDYGRWLAQMLLVHRALEEPLARLREDPSWASFFAAVRPEQMQEPYLRADLAALGIDCDAIEALPATRELTDLLEATAASEPVALLGHHYVLEGSNNGNRFIARKLLPALELAPGVADRYLDPYGDEQPRLWRQFKEEMGEIEFTPGQIDRMVEAAQATFHAIARLSEQLQGAAAPA